MADFERLLIDPTPAELAKALAAAARTANARAKANVVRPDAKAFRRAVDGMLERPEGWLPWEPYRVIAPRTLLACAWWTDAARRRHWRVAATRTDAPLPAGELFRPGGRPPLALVHPDRVWVRHFRGRRELLAVCGCGVSGAPADLAWMGACCGPCHDRHLERGMPPDALPELRPVTIDCHRSGVTAVALAAGGRLVAAGAGDGSVRLWETAGGREVFATPAGTDPVWSVSLAPDGGRLAVGWAAGTVAVFDTAGGGELARWRPGLYGAAPVFSPDGRFLATVEGEQLHLLDVAALPERRAVRSFAQPATRITFSLDGRHLAAALPGSRVGVWDLIAGRQNQITTNMSRDLTAMDVSPDGELVAVGCGRSDWEYEPDGSPCPGVTPPVLLFDVSTGNRLKTPGGHDDSVTAVAFAPHLRRSLLSAGLDATVRLWDVIGGCEHSRYEGCPGPLRAMAFSADGRLLALGGDDGRVHLWPWRRLLGDDDA
jgi:WD domain, G-beta repeat